MQRRYVTVDMCPCATALICHERSFQLINLRCRNRGSRREFGPHQGTAEPLVVRFRLRGRRCRLRRERRQTSLSYQRAISAWFGIRPCGVSRSITPGSTRDNSETRSGAAMPVSSDRFSTA